MLPSYKIWCGQKYVPALADQVIHQVFHLVRLASRHNELLQMCDVFGVQQFLVLSVLDDES